MYEVSEVVVHVVCVDSAVASSSQQWLGEPAANRGVPNHTGTGLFHPQYSIHQKSEGKKRNSYRGITVLYTVHRHILTSTSSFGSDLLDSFFFCAEISTIPFLVALT